LRPEQRPFEHHVVDLDLVKRPLVVRELTDQLDEGGDVRSSRRTYHLDDRIRRALFRVGRDDPVSAVPLVASTVTCDTAGFICWSGVSHRVTPLAAPEL